MASGHSPLFKSIEIDPLELINDGDDLFPEETEILSSFVSRQAKYGSTSSHKFTSQKFITHDVQPHDTLQGMLSSHLT